MILGILKEPDFERRVAMLPEHIPSLSKFGFTSICVEKGAGNECFQDDASFEAKGVKVCSRADVLKTADLILGIHPLAPGEFVKGKSFITQMNPLAVLDGLDPYVNSGASLFSMDLVPRTTKAQAMDVLSSMATAAGYKAVLTAAQNLTKFFPMFMTAAGTIPPAKVLILGAGVAGLQAISTAKRLGAVVEAFDVRAAAKEEVLSLGAKFVEVEGAKDDASAGGYAVEQTEEYKQKQAALIQEHAAKSDVVICTAQIPGRRAPLLVTEETLKNMKPGSVVVDLAASTGGNCACTKNGETITVHNVCIVGDSNLPSSIPYDASKMFGKNIINFFGELIKDQGIDFDFENEIIANTCLAHEGKLVSPRILSILENANSKK
jgi:NAD(P) transhydrogenase subunit alpha